MLVCLHCEMFDAYPLCKYTLALNARVFSVLLRGDVALQGRPAASWRRCSTLSASPHRSATPFPSHPDPALAHSSLSRVRSLSEPMYPWLLWLTLAVDAISPSSVPPKPWPWLTLAPDVRPGPLVIAPIP